MTTMPLGDNPPIPPPEDPARRSAEFRTPHGRAPAGPAHEPAADGTREQPPAPGGQGELILAVDDEPTVRILAAQILESFGYRVITAENGAEAVALYKQHASEIALVVTDMTMPVMDGPAMVMNLRGINPGLPIIVASGTDTEPARAKFRAFGVRHFLPKPYTAKALANLVNVALRETTPAR